MKKITKTFVGLLLATTASTALVACGGDDSTGGGKGEGKNPSNATETTSYEQVSGKAYKFQKSEVSVPNHTADQKAFINANLSTTTYDEFMKELKESYAGEGDDFYVDSPFSGSCYYTFSSVTNKLEFYNYYGLKMYPFEGGMFGFDGTATGYYFAQDGDQIRLYDDSSKTVINTGLSAVAKKGSIEITMKVTAKRMYPTAEIANDFEIFTLKVTATPGDVNDSLVDEVIANRQYTLSNPTYDLSDVSDNNKAIVEANKVVINKYIQEVVAGLSFSFDTTTKEVTGVSTVDDKYNFNLTYSQEVLNTGLEAGNLTNKMFFKDNTNTVYRLRWSNKGKKLYMYIDNILNLEGDYGEIIFNVNDTGKAPVANYELVSGNAYKFAKSEVIIPNHTAEQKAFITENFSGTYDSLMSELESLEGNGDNFYIDSIYSSECHYSFSSITGKLEFYENDGLRGYPFSGGLFGGDETITAFYYTQEGNKIKLYNDAEKTILNPTMSAVAKKGGIELLIKTTAKALFKDTEIANDFEIFTLKVTATPGNIAGVALDTFTIGKTYKLASAQYSFDDIIERDKQILEANKANLDKYRDDLLNGLTFTFDTSNNKMIGSSTVDTKYNFELTYEPHVADQGPDSGKTSNYVTLYESDKTYSGYHLHWSVEGKKLILSINKDVLGVSENVYCGLIIFDIVEA